MVNKETVRLFFREKTKRPLAFKDVVSGMDLNRKEARSLKKILRSMLRDGELVITRKGLYGPPEDMSLMSGYFEPHKEGYGFVVLESPGERDIFVPARATMGAMNHDRVIVRVSNWHKREGHIVRILERAQARIVGTFEVTRTGLFVRPKNRFVHVDLSIAKKDRGRAKHGDMVIAEITSYPTERKHATGKVVKILGQPQDPKAEVEAVIDEFNLVRRFPLNVSKEARSLYDLKVAGTGLKVRERRDLRELRTVTIDGENAKDFDDAISIDIDKHGYKLHVHIADVGFYVGWNSLVDIEARKRGTSVYFPDRVIPMLPKELSEDLCSLKPREERYAMTVEIDFDRNGGRLKTQCYPSVIVSNERMTYTAVKKILIDHDDHERVTYDYLLRDFELMGELCGILRNRRMKRGSLDFDLPEPEVVLDLQGVPDAIVRAERNYAHMIIEEFMIAANESVADYLTALGMPILYRIHEEPDPSKFKEILNVAKYVYKKGSPQKSKDFSELLRKIKGKPEEEIINYVILRSLKQARYSIVNVGHFGLASKCYTHFTSPIRRYPDLVVHRILREVMKKKQLTDRRIKEFQTLLPDIAFHSSRMERVADRAEKEVVDAMRAWFMKDKIGDDFDGKIVGITPYGVKVRLKDFYIEGFLHVSYLTDDFYQYNERRMTLVGRHTKRSFNIGQDIKVKIENVDMEERGILFGVLDV
jgi:ribonuclease R